MRQQPPSAIAAYARGARALVMPSRYFEPFDLVTAEALRSGLPVIAAETAFLTQDIVAAGAGMAIYLRNIANFASVLRRLAEDAPGAQAINEAAFDNTASIALASDVWIDQLDAVHTDPLRKDPVMAAHAA